MQTSMTDQLSQAELIELSGKLNRATELAESRCAVYRFADAEADRRAEMAAELRAIRDRVTLAPVRRPVPASELFAPSQDDRAAAVSGALWGGVHAGQADIRLRRVTDVSRRSRVFRAGYGIAHIGLPGWPPAFTSR